MKSSRNRNISEKFIEAAGHLTQSLGIGKVTGQIYAFLYLNQEPQSLGQITDGLKISKGSASMCVRQLEQWKAIRRIWVKGDRKDFYSANDDFGIILKNVIADLTGKKIDASARLINDAREHIEKIRLTAKTGSSEEFFIKRINKLQEFHSKTSSIWNNVIIKLMK